MTGLKEREKTPGMTLFAAKEFVKNYEAVGVKKSGMQIPKMFILAVLAGVIVALCAVQVNTAIHTITDYGLAKIVSGLLFPFALFIVIITGSELFTGNCLMIMPVLSRTIKFSGMLKNLAVVYLGNFAGSLIIAWLCAKFGQFDISGGQLAVVTMKTAIAKSTLPFGNALVFGILCNVLVCAGVMCAYCAKDVAGRAIGSYMPVCIFVIAGFEHCIANMYYIPAGIFAASVPKYAQLASEAGLDLSALTWGNFLGANLLPVTIGNIAGGILFAIAIWYCHREK